MDAFDIFDDEPGAAPTATATAPIASSSLAPRAREHPAFRLSHWVWPVAPADLDAGLSESSRLLLRQRAEACVTALRKSKHRDDTYASAAATALAAASTAFESSDLPAVQLESKRCADFCTAQLEEGNWSSPCWQECNLLALGFRLVSTVLPTAGAAAAAEADDTHELLGRGAIALFNLGLTMLSGHDASNLTWLPDLLQWAERAINAVHPPHRALPTSDAAWLIPTSPPAWCTPTIRHPIRSTSEALPCARFFTEHLQPGQPLLMHGHLAAEEWGGLEYFQSLRALHQEHGNRLVPITIGAPLVGYGGTRHWPLRKLIEEHLLPSNATHAAPEAAVQGASDHEQLCDVAYCAQHHLLHQCEALQSLLAVPPFTLGRELSPPNLWLGTRGTVTSLHSDPSDNLLCQLAGFKYVRLYALDQTDRLYARVMRGKNTNAFGTSPVRVEAPDLDAYPEFGDASYTEAILGPGDMLFIPKSVWHYVRSLTTSCSVNLWY